jgi:ribosome-associated toxin RatA of RatAB toxin-antitoxin module
VKALSCVLVASTALAQPVTPPPLDSSEMTRLATGDILVRDFPPTGGKGVASRAIGVIDAPPAEVWAIVSTCKLFFQFMPRVKKSWVKTEPGVGELCHVELTMPFPLTDLWSDSTQVAREEPAGHFQLSWTMVRGSYHRSDGSWMLVPFGDGSKCLVIYSVDTEPKMIIPDGLIRLGQNSSLPEVITRIRQRVTTLRAEAAKAPVRDGGGAP